MKELDSILKNIKNKELLPLYFLHGEESYYIDVAVKAFENEVLSEDEKAFNQTVAYGKDTSYPEILSLARQYPMMGDRQVIIVKEAQDLKLTDEEAKLLMAYVENPVPSTLLVFAHKNKKLDGNKRKLHAALKSYLFLSDKMKDYEVPKFIQSELSRLDIKTAPNIFMLLSEYLGTDLSRISNELNKLKIALKPGEILDGALVEKHIGISKDFNVFELQKALGTKDAAKALRIVHFIGKNPKAEPLQKILGFLYNYFSNMVIFQSLAGKPQSEVAAAMKTTPYFLRDYAAAARFYPLKHATRILSLLRETDLKNKGLGVNQTPESELLTELVYKILNIDKLKTKI